VRDLRAFIVLVNASGGVLLTNRATRLLFSSRATTFRSAAHRLGGV
jgi:hypothetical protein